MLLLSAGPGSAPIAHALYGEEGDPLVLGGSFRSIGAISFNYDNDLLFGGWGEDRLVGGWGADTLDGARGADSLHGGRGADIFVFGPGDGADRIRDFEDGIDKVDLTGFGFANEAAALSGASQAGSAIEFDMGGGDILTVASTTVAELAGDLIV